jgi:hypothetical protein
MPRDQTPKFVIIKKRKAPIKAPPTLLFKLVIKNLEKKELS